MEAHQTSNLGVLGSSPRQDVRKIFDRSEIEGYPIIKQYKYLGITIDNKMK